MKQLLKNSIRKVLGTFHLSEQNRLLEQKCQHLESQVSTLIEQVNTLSQTLTALSQPEKVVPILNAVSGKHYLPLDYPPSFDYQGRWGYRTPPHQELTDWFNSQTESYNQTINSLVSLKENLLAIPTHFNLDQSSEPGWLGGAINPLDTALLYHFVSSYRPKIYLEIGSGLTTLFAARAKRDFALDTQIISIDPHPRASIDQVCNKIIRSGLEVTDLTIFSELEAGDMVFMDGSHRSFMNSDVTVFMLDILPKLKPGVIVHFHDIVLPYDYDKMFWYWYWNEQYILAAYLLGAKDRIKILMPSRFVSQLPHFSAQITPILNSWTEETAGWLSGGSLWFTHISSFA